MFHALRCCCPRPHQGENFWCQCVAGPILRRREGMHMLRQRALSQHMLCLPLVPSRMTCRPHRVCAPLGLGGAASSAGSRTPGGVTIPAFVFLRVLGRLWWFVVGCCCSVCRGRRYTWLQFRGGVCSPLALCLTRLWTSPVEMARAAACRMHVRRWCCALAQISNGDPIARRQRQEAERASALAKIDADREAQHARAEREQAVRRAAGVHSVKSPWKPKRVASSGRDDAGGVGRGPGSGSGGGSSGEFPED